MKKKKSQRPDPTPGRSSTPSERVCWLLANLWNGNRSEMARSVGVTHSVLTKIAAGQQNPGRRLLAAIASHPKVSPGWLLSGEGEPILADSRSAPEEGWPVPISTQVLSGPLDEHRSLLSGESFPVPGAFYRPSRYWLKLYQSDPIVQSGECMESGDLLLMESDPNSWATEERVNQKICVVQLAGASGPQLGRVSWYPGDAEEAPSLTVDVYNRTVDPSHKVTRITTILHPSGKVESHARPMVLTGQTGSKRLTNVGQPLSHSIGLRNIVGVCMLLVRQ